MTTAVVAGAVSVVCALQPEVRIVTLPAALGALACCVLAVARRTRRVRATASAAGLALVGVAAAVALQLWA